MSSGVTSLELDECGGVEERLVEIRNAIIRSAHEEKRDPAAIKLIAVSKTVSAEVIRPLLEAGHREFGENRVQEAKSKWPSLKQEFPDIRLHLIGPLQSNKVRDAISLFDVIHSVDRISLAQELSLEQERLGRAQMPQLFVQVNTGEEPQKAGVSPQLADDFIAECREKYGLSISGLMCIPPADLPPSAHFALLRKIAQRNDIKDVSMGMSADFEQAVMLGSTHVRIGSALFGDRVPSV